MSWVPEFELGIWNEWIFMIWWVVLPFLFRFIVKEKKGKKLKWKQRK
jgi:hypothetical protein